MDIGQKNARKTAISFLLLLCLIFLTACGSEGKWQKQYDLGMRYLSEQNYEEAVIAFTAAIQIDARRIEAYIGRGEAYIGKGETEDNLDAAMADYQAVLEMDKSNVSAYLGLADVYIRQKDYDNAIAILKVGLDNVSEKEALLKKLEELESGSIFDSDNRMRMRTTYDSAGNLIWYHTFDYDEQGRQSVITAFDGAHVMTGQINCVYDTDGNMIEGMEGWYGDDGYIQKGWFTYNEAGQQTSVEWISRFGGETHRRETSYDSQGRPASVTSISGNGRYKSIESYEYADHKVIRRTTDQNGRLMDIYIREQDNQGRDTTAYYYDGNNNLIHKEVYEYDADGRLTAGYLYDADGSLKQKTVY